MGPGWDVADLETEPTGYLYVTIRVFLQDEWICAFCTL
jgi:hypothetical protein